MSMSVGPVQAQSAVRGGAAVRPLARTANWTVGLAAATLVLISVAGYFYCRGQLAAIGAEHLRLVVTGPSRLQAGAAATYTVSARSIGGGPLPAEIEVVLSAPDGSRLKAYKETADEHGLLQVVIPAGLELPSWVRLGVVARYRESRQRSEATLAVAPDQGRYRLVARRPDGASAAPGKTDDASPENHVVLLAGPGEIPAGAPLEFHVRTDKAGLPLVAAAYCRGVEVWQQHGESGVADNLLTVPLDEALCGVIRLVVYDYSFSPPKPVAERLVYRRPASRLDVQAAPDRKQYAPGQEVQVSLLVTDERGRPVPAVLDVSVVDEALLKPADGFALAPPLMCDNLEQIRADYEKCLADYQAGRTAALNTLTLSSFLGGLGLVLLVAMLGLMRIVSGIHLWVAAVGATTCCLIVGAILMDPGRMAPAEGVAVPFRGYQAPLEKSPFRNPLPAAGPDGKASLRFRLPEAPAVFRVTIDAYSGGRLGSRRLEIRSLR